MTLPSSGPLSMSAINAEFGRGNNLNSYRGTVWYTDAGASGTFSSGAISFNEFYGKRPTSPSFSFSIGSNQTNADLRTLAINAGWNQSSALVATINGGVYISASSTGVYALYIQGSFPGGLTVYNYGAIVGCGGNGGAGANDYGSRAGGAGGGATGGPALYVASGTTFYNYGTIAGGGGGGGGGGSGSGVSVDGKYGSATSWYVAGSGGGGGRSSLAANSAGGAGGDAQDQFSVYKKGNPGGAGTVNGAGGGGASAVNANGNSGGAGGSGGGWGASGASGGSGTGQIYGPAGGGGGGWAVVGNGNISWAVTGTRLGGIT